MTTDPATRARYSQAGGIHRIVPRAVARPTSESELLEVLAWARHRQLPVTPRGAGTAMDGGSVGEGMVLDLTAFDPVASEVDAARHRARVSPSTPLATLTAAARSHRLRFGPDPSSSAWATVGGVIGTNAAGARSHRLGAVDRWVDTLTLLTTEGPLRLARGVAPDPRHPVVERFHREAGPVLAVHRTAVEARWPRTTKNTAGYALTRFWDSGDLLDLVIGAEGTLGVVTEAVLRLEPLPPCTAALRVVLGERRDLPGAIALLEPFHPVAVELLDGSLLRLIPGDLAAAGVAVPPGGVILLVDLEDDAPEPLAERLAGAVRQLTPVSEAVAHAVSPREREALWAIRHAASPLLAGLGDDRRSLQVVEDGCVPVASLADYLEGVQRSCDSAGIEAVMFGHAGDGHVHVNLLPDLGTPDWLERVGRVHDEVFALLVALGGTPAGEHGAGRLRAGILEALLGPGAIACFRAVKAAFDPDGVLNPGVILHDGTPALARLKVGPDATELPPTVEHQLRAIEAGRRWGESRWPVTG